MLSNTLPWISSAAVVSKLLFASRSLGRRPAATETLVGQSGSAYGRPQTLVGQSGFGLRPTKNPGRRKQTLVGENPGRTCFFRKTLVGPTRAYQGNHGTKTTLI